METIVTGSVPSGGEEAVTSSAADDGVQVLQVSIPNQPVQVQSVIHPTGSVIQHDGRVYRTIQLVTPVAAEETDEEVASRNRREILARRPSYRKILNELSDSQAITVTKIEEESNSSQTSQESGEGNEAATNLSTNAITSSYQSAANVGLTVVSGQAIQLAGPGDGTAQGLQTLTMTNVNTTQANSAQGATIVQYAQGPDGQFFIPAGSVQAYQISTPTSLPQGVVMATAGTAITSPQQLTEEASRKRELRLLKNRDAARECRRKRKDYVKCLENRVAVLENQNKALIDELKSLKELYCQKE